MFNKRHFFSAHTANKFARRIIDSVNLSHLASILLECSALIYEYNKRDFKQISIYNNFGELNQIKQSSPFSSLPKALVMAAVGANNTGVEFLARVPLEATGEVQAPAAPVTGDSGNTDFMARLFITDIGLSTLGPSFAFSEVVW